MSENRGTIKNVKGTLNGTLKGILKRTVKGKRGYSALFLHLKALSGMLGTAVGEAVLCIFLCRKQDMAGVINSFVF